MQDGDSYLPPYIKDAAFGNQITRGLYDTNRTLPKMSKDGFLQHIAMSVNTNFGDISYHLENLKKNKVRLIQPRPTFTTSFPRSIWDKEFYCLNFLSWQA